MVKYKDKNKLIPSNKLSEYAKIRDYSQLYMINPKGEVISLKSLRKLKQTKNHYGYLVVNLSKKGKVKQFKVHRLIAETFISNPLNKRTINHINGIKTDNRLENLEWSTYSENLKHKFRVLGYINNRPNKDKFGKLHHNSKKVNQYDKNMNLIKTWGSLMDIQRELKINNSSISNVCLLKPNYRTAGGFIWRYINGK